VSKKIFLFVNWAYQRFWLQCPTCYAW
jgi:hypothetical protein